MQAAQIQAIKERNRPLGPMNEQQISLLRDIQTFLEFCIGNGLSFPFAIGTLSHDVNGILAPNKYFEQGAFTPKVMGYARQWPETQREMAELANDPEMTQEHAERQQAESTSDGE